MSTLKVDAITDTSGGTNVDVPNAAKAWVNFNGQGTVAIREDFNVSSITDNATGDYTVNFTTAMPDNDYAMCVQQTRNTSIFNTSGQFVVSTATTNYRIQTTDSNFSKGDAADVTSFVVR